MSGGRLQRTRHVLRQGSKRLQEALRAMISRTVLSTGLAASLLGSACSSAAVAPPEAPATIESTPAPAAPSPASQTNTAPAQPAPESDPKTHPYDFLWKAAAVGANPFEHSKPPAGDPGSDGAVGTRPDATTSRSGGAEAAPGVSTSGDADEPDSVIPQEDIGKGPGRPNAPDPSASGDTGNDPDLLALQGEGGWRKQDLQELAPYLEGIASWYGPNFHGKLTANGETYNQYGLTAAHPVLPIGTRIMVENLNNGNRVWVRVNDRGPYAKGRILDLSYMAAERLGMIEHGTAPVRITVLQWPTTLQASFGLKSFQQYTVQMAAYPELDTAEDLRERLQARFPQYPFFIEPASKGFFAVAAGPFDDEREAKGVSRQIHRSGYNPMVRRYRN
jgi:rare lipoprotein A